MMEARSKRNLPPRTQCELTLGGKLHDSRLAPLRRGALADRSRSPPPRPRYKSLAELMLPDRSRFQVARIKKPSPKKSVGEPHPSTWNSVTQ
jgi:hypothetical protein